MSVKAKPPSQSGLYNDRFRAFELKVLSLVDSSSLEDEIKLLRLYMHRVLVLAGSIDDLSLAIKVLNSLGSTSQRIMNLYKAQLLLIQSKDDQVSRALAQVLEEFAEEFNKLEPGG